jgi:hypothetical protein
MIETVAVIAMLTAVVATDEGGFMLGMLWGIVMLATKLNERQGRR